MTNNNRVQPVQRGWVLRERTLKNTIVFLGLLVLTNHNIGSISRMLYWGILLVCSGALFLIASSWNRRVQINGFVVWMLCFFMACTISWVYSVDRGTSWTVIKGQIVNLVLVIGILWNTRNEADVYDLIKTVFGVIIFNSVYLVLLVDWSTIGTDRMGQEYTGEGWNANAIGMMSIWGILLAIYLAKTLGNKKYYLPVPLMLLLIVFSGSRTAWLMLAMVLIVYIFINNRKHLFAAVLIAVATVAVLYYLMLNVKWLYEIGGHRLESLFLGMSDTGEMDSSAEKRLSFISMGWEWFQEKPLFGYGVHAFGAMLYKTSYQLQTYSHNNYIELLVGVGIVGTLVYYAIYFPILLRLLKKVLRERKSAPAQFTKSALLLAIIAISLVMHYGTVAYTKTFDTIMILIPYMYLKTSGIKQSLQTDEDKGV